jgi:hypothetical protein
LSPCDDLYKSYSDYLDAEGLTFSYPQHFLWAIAIVSQKLDTEEDDQEFYKKDDLESSDILANLTITTNANGQLVCSYKNMAFDLVMEAEQNWSQIADRVDYLRRNLILRELINKKVSEDLEKNIHTAVLLTSKPVNKYAYTVKVEDANPNLGHLPATSKYNDEVVKNPFGKSNKPERDSYFKQLERRQDIAVLQQFDVCKAFEARTMPKHPVMGVLKKYLEKYIPNYKQMHNVQTLFDPMDLLYQVAFRLTTFEYDQIFSNFKTMKGLPPSDGFEQSTMGDYRYLSAISHFDWSKLEIRPELIDRLIVEQLELCQRRYAESKLDVTEVLGKSGIFGEAGWSIIQTKDGIICVNANDRTKTKKIRFGEVDPKFAEDFHKTFHYIHAPRVDRSFGLFLEGSDTPFTVGGIEPIDRQYKKDALLIYGFDPDKFFDFTRLYSLPGVPKNASSVISSCIKDQLLQRPNVSRCCFNLYAYICKW